MAENLTIRIELDPVNDGVINAGAAKTEVCREDRHALVIATNGEMKLISHGEAQRYMTDLQEKSASKVLGEMKYMLVYNADKTICVEGGDYLVGSALIMRISGCDFVTMTEEEISEAQQYFEEHLGILKAGDMRFSALEI